MKLQHASNMLAEWQALALASPSAHARRNARAWALKVDRLALQELDLWRLAKQEERQEELALQRATRLRHGISTVWVWAAIALNLFLWVYARARAPDKVTEVSAVIQVSETLPIQVVLLDGERLDACQPAPHVHLVKPSPSLRFGHMRVTFVPAPSVQDGADLELVDLLAQAAGQTMVQLSVDATAIAGNP